VSTEDAAQPRRDCGLGASRLLALLRQAGHARKRSSQKVRSIDWCRIIRLQQHPTPGWHLCGCADRPVDRVTRSTPVAVLRAEAGRNPHDQDLTNLIGELSTQSEEFRVRWARHDVRYHDTGLKRIHHPLVGELELAYEVMTLAADPDLVMFAFTSEVGSKSEEALNLLASWTATEDEPIAADTSHHRNE
jgi:hypothetical protein